ncbi:MAG: class II fructose-bisphosphate aldolase [Anaerolineae bacterium]|nr:class II fructose-bisphosphate aldolase [Anaerolineae bacterium]
MWSTADAIRRAQVAGIVVPAFNAPYLPMIEPLIRAVIDQDAFALIETARLEWLKFESVGPAAVMAEFERWADLDHVRLHLDHVPAIDEDDLAVDYMPIFEQAIVLGYGSVMIDGSRLSLQDNIRVTRQVVEMAHRAGIPCEAELGAVLGHEAGPLPPYEELFASGKGFTDVQEAARFVRETDCDWLSVAVGNIHGAISGAAKAQAKIETRLNLEHLDRLRQATGIPLVLHGGSGVQHASLLAAIPRGIVKVNVAAEIRRAYEVAVATSDVEEAQMAVYARTSELLRRYFGVAGKRKIAAEEGVP